VDSAESTALAVAEMLKSGVAQSDKRAETSMRFFVTDSSEKFRRLGTRFLGQQITDITHVDLKE
jgi:glutamate racemase